VPKPLGDHPAALRWGYMNVNIMTNGCGRYKPIKSVIKLA